MRIGKRAWKKFFMLVLTLGIVIDMDSGSVQAAGKQEALKAYRVALESTGDTKKSSSYNFAGHGVIGDKFKFAVIDLNKDSIPELAVTADDTYHLLLFGFVNDKIKLVSEGFSGETRYYPNKSLFYSATCHSGGDVEGYYKFNGKTMKELAYKYGNDSVNVITGEKKQNQLGEFAPYLYKVKGKKVNQKKYKKKIKSILAGAKEQKLQWHKNSDRNRKKYLK